MGPGLSKVTLTVLFGKFIYNHYNFILIINRNLQTWPLELVDWPTNNSLRQDIFIDPTPNIDLEYNVEALEILPCNERPQGMWNANPFQLSGGTGFAEYDAGSWLCPYWMARYYGLIV